MENEDEEPQNGYGFLKKQGGKDNVTALDVKVRVSQVLCLHMLNCASKPAIHMLSCEQVKLNDI